MSKYKCIVDIRIGWAVEVDALTEEHAKKKAEELAWDNQFYHPMSDVSTNDVECDDASEITTPQEDR